MFTRWGWILPGNAFKVLGKSWAARKRQSVFCSRLRPLSCNFHASSGLNDIRRPFAKSWSSRVQDPVPARARPRWSTSFSMSTSFNLLAVHPWLQELRCLVRQRFHCHRCPPIPHDLPAQHHQQPRRALASSGLTWVSESANEPARLSVFKIVEIRLSLSLLLDRPSCGSSFPCPALLFRCRRPSSAFEVKLPSSSTYAHDAQLQCTLCTAAEPPSSSRLVVGKQREWWFRWWRRRHTKRTAVELAVTWKW